MPECHKCPLATKVSQGAYSHLPWKKTPCYNCHWTGDQDNHHGMSMVSMEAGATESGQTLAEVEASIMTELKNSDDPGEQVTLINQAADVRIARGLLSLSKRHREIALAVIDCLADGHIMGDYRTQAEVSRRIGTTTPQAISAALQEIIRAWPDFQAITDRIFDASKQRFIRGVQHKGGAK